MVNDEGWTALHYAARTSARADVIGILFDAMDDPCVASKTVASAGDQLGRKEALRNDPVLRRLFHGRCVEGR